MKIFIKTVAYALFIMIAFTLVSVGILGVIFLLSIHPFFIFLITAIVLGWLWAIEDEKGSYDDHY